MTAIIAIFSLSLMLVLILTPQVDRVARKYHLVDTPSERKVHTQTTPRIGGVAIYLAFILSFISSLFYFTRIADLLVLNRQVIALLLGATLAFGVGLGDDVRRLRPMVKLMAQVIGALIAYAGGIKISMVTVPGASVALGFLSLPATLFWFLLVVNAINLIDGLDGLAAGVCFFVSMVLLVLCVMTNDRFLVVIGLAALGGASLGFLRYNFNPAKQQDQQGSSPGHVTETNNDFFCHAYIFQSFNLVISRQL